MNEAGKYQINKKVETRRFVLLHVTIIYVIIVWFHEQIIQVTGLYNNMTCREQRCPSTQWYQDQQCRFYSKSSRKSNYLYQISFITHCSLADEQSNRVILAQYLESKDCQCHYVAEWPPQIGRSRINLRIRITVHGRPVSRFRLYLRYAML